MQIWYIFFSFIFYFIEIGMFLYLCVKVKHHHSLTLKDTAIYPLVVLLTMIVLFIAQFHYANATTTTDAVGVLHDGVGIVTLSINSNLVKILWTHEEVSARFIVIAYIGSYFISALALFSLSLSLLKVAIFNFGRSFKLLLSGKEKNYIFGFNDDTKEYLKNLSKIEKRKTIVVLNNSIIDKYVDEKLFLDKYKIKFILLPYSNNKEMYKSIKKVTYKRILSKIKALFNLSIWANVYIITFLETDKENYDFVFSAQKFLYKYGLLRDPKELEVKKKKSIFKYQFIISVNTIQSEFLQELVCSTYYNATDKEQAKYEGMEDYLKESKDKSHGLIRIFNKYELTSLDFIKNYSFANYLNVKNEDGNVIEYVNDNCTIKEECDINLIFLGFGNVNQVLLRDLLINNQFAEIKNGKLSSKRVKVKIYEKEKKLNSLQLSNGLLKYKKTNYVDENCNLDNSNNYFGLIDDYISNIDMTKFDTVIGDKDFMNDLYDFIHDNSSRMKFNFFVVSVGTDFENCTIADTIKKDLESIDRSKSKSIFYARTKETYNMPDGINPFGNYSKILSYENVVKNEINETALENHYLYSHHINNKLDDEKKMDMMIEYSTNSYIERISNMYAVYSLYSKLALLKANDLKKYREKYVIPNIQYKNLKLVIDFSSINEMISSEDIVIINNKKDIKYMREGSTIIIPVEDYIFKESIEKDKNTSKYINFNSAVYVLLKTEIKDYKKINIKLMKENNEVISIKLDFNEPIEQIDGFKHVIGFKLTSPISNLSQPQGKYEARDVLAFIEHERWNAFELSNGVLPRKITLCFNENGAYCNKSKNEMYHACITNQNGLYDMYKKVLKEGKGIFKDGKEILSKIEAVNKADVISYDYELMDYLYDNFDNINERLKLYKEEKEYV